MDRDAFETRQIHAGDADDAHGAVIPPIYTSATYEYDEPTAPRGSYRYSRMASPTRDDLESLLADLEGGTDAVAFASGMAAIDAVFSLLSPGDHVVAANNLYAETHDLLVDVYRRYGIDVTQVDSTDTAAIDDAVRPETALVYLESPTNPVLNVADIEAAATVAAGADATLAVDNTFASPYLQRPLELGADLAIESLTKYVSGHSDAILGAVATRDPDLTERLSTVQYTRGAIPGPHACYLAARGAKTLAPRMERHCRNARAVVDHLRADGRVDRVYYPGLDSHPNHAVAAAQMDDFGGMVSFELDASVEVAAAFVSGLELVTLAESLGGVESLVELPAVMTHQDLDADALASAGIGESLVRLSVGIERPEDIVADLDAALDRAFEA
jgi:cystathionine gamma-lyase